MIVFLEQTEENIQVLTQKLARDLENALEACRSFYLCSVTVCFQSGDSLTYHRGSSDKYFKNNFCVLQMELSALLCREDQPVFPPSW